MSFENFLKENDQRKSHIVEWDALRGGGVGSKIFGPKSEEKALAFIEELKAKGAKNIRVDIVKGAAKYGRSGNGESALYHDGLIKKYHYNKTK